MGIFVKMAAQNLYKNQLGKGGYSVSEVAWLLGIPRDRVARYLKKYWDAVEEEGVSWRVGKGKAVNFYVLVEFRVVDALLEAGFSVQKIIKNRLQLKEDLKTPYPFANTKVLHDGKSLYAKLDAGTIKVDGKKQLIIEKLIESYLQKLDFDTNDIATKYWPNGKDTPIVVDPNHQFGMPIIYETNIKADLVFDLYQHGDDIPFIASIYNIDPKDIAKVIQYYEHRSIAA
jgi:uncharacterized protein (DUF433 family)